MQPSAGSTVAALGEQALIERLRRLVPTADPGILLGIGDDAAVLRFAGQVLATCDIQVEGVHFLPDLSLPADVGWRALAVNLSDIAAMGGLPRFALVSLALPPATALTTADALYSGLGDCATTYGVTIAGGNLSGISGPLVIDITLLGEADRVIRRTGARPGDGVWVTGAVGKASAGLFVLRHPGLKAPGTDALAHAYRRPLPRVAAGRALGKTAAVTAMIDTSDGTVTDLLHLVEASDVGVRLELDRVPVADGVDAVARAAGRDPTPWILGGGEDYELLFTAAPAFDSGAADLARTVGVRLTRIGEILPLGAGRWIVDSTGRQTPLASSGWDHFRREGVKT
jgi:thiamine-monophosphate kinase